MTTFSDQTPCTERLTEAVVDNQDAHNTIADYFFSDGPGISAVIMALADAFYEAAIDQRTDVGAGRPRRGRPSLESATLAPPVSFRC